MLQFSGTWKACEFDLPSTRHLCVKLNELWDVQRLCRLWVAISIILMVLFAGKLSQWFVNLPGHPAEWKAITCNHLQKLVWILLERTSAFLSDLRRGDMEVVPKLVAALTDSELRVRMAATDALRQVAPKLNFCEVQRKMLQRIMNLSFSFGAYLQDRR